MTDTPPEQRVGDQLDEKADYEDLREEVRMVQSAILRSRAMYRPDVIECGDPPPDLIDLKIGMVSRPVQLALPGEHYAGAQELAAAEIHVTTEFEPGVNLPGPYRVVVPVDAEQIRTARTWILERINALGEQGANLICLNELAYPAFKSMVACERISLDERARLSAEDVEFRTAVQAIADRCDAVIVAGTFHDPQDLYNKAVIFVPNFAVVDHMKLTSAKSPKVGEVIRTPGDPSFKIYDTNIGSIAVLICLDAFDLNMLFRQVVAGDRRSNESRPDIVVVPAYTPQNIEDACKELSYFGNNVVIYCNALDQAQPCNAVYVSGIPHEPVRDKPERLVSISAEQRSEYSKDNRRRRRRGLIHHLLRGSLVLRG